MNFSTIYITYSGEKVPIEAPSVASMGSVAMRAAEEVGIDNPDDSAYRFVFMATKVGGQTFIPDDDLIMDHEGEVFTLVGFPR